MTQFDYKVHGNDLQYVQFTLGGGQEAIAEQGAMMFIDEHIAVNAILGDGSASSFGVVGRFINAVKRSFTGESMFSSLYVNNSDYPQDVAIAAPGPGEIVPVNLDEHGGSIICQKGAYLAGQRGQRVQLAFQKRVRVGLFGGEGFIMQRISGHGTAFIHASGTLKQVTLGPAHTLKIDTGCLVAMSSNVRYDVKYIGKLKTSLFGGEGLFYATVSGPGTVWMQSLPMNRLSKVLMTAAITGRGKGSLLGKLYLVGIVVFVIISLFVGEL